MSSPKRIYEYLLGIGIKKEIAEAFLKVPRERFVFVDLNPDRIYSDDAILTFKDGEIYSTSSQPSLMAEFMQEVGLKKGMKVLEIGGGTGYNAAVMSHVVGDDGLVVSVESEEKVCSCAKRVLAEHADKGNLIYICGDGYYGVEEYSPYDAIIVTVAVDEVSPYWIDQLRDFGRMVVPMNVFSIGFYQPTMVFRKEGEMIKGRMRFVTSFLKAGGRLGCRNEKVKELFGKIDCEPSEKLYMDRSGMSILEILTGFIGKNRGFYIYADGFCKAIYKFEKWHLCGGCERLERAVSLLEREGFPSLDRVLIGFNKDRTEFYLSREG